METQGIWSFKALPAGAASISPRGQVHHQNSPAPAPWRAPRKPAPEWTAIGCTPPGRSSV